MTTKKIDQGGRKAVLSRLGLTPNELTAKIAWDLEIYVTGSAVRDPLCGLVADDTDHVVVGATHEKMVELGFDCVGNEFPNFLHPITRDDFALARLERKTGPGHQGFECTTDGITLEQDLARRDLTINAIARRLGSDELIDPCGGMEDIKNKVLRHIGPAYSEDPLRVLRTCRFMAKIGDFRIAEETMQLMRQLVDDGKLDELTPERVWVETEKALKCQSPWLYFESMSQCGALDVIFPELDALIGQEQPIEHHPEGDAWVHTLLVLESACQMTSDVHIRWAAMMHDLGKGLTLTGELPKHHGHSKRGVEPIEAMAKRLKIPKLFTKYALLGAQTHHKIHDMGKASAVKRLLDILKVKHGDELLEVACVIATSDQRGRGPTKEDGNHENIPTLREAAKAYKSVKVREGLEGNSLKDALTQDRVLAVKKALSMFSNT